MKNIFVINILISLAITVLLIVLLPPFFNKYEIKLCGIKTMGEDMIVKYVDLDSDGYSEMLKYCHYPTKQVFVENYDKNEKLTGIWNLLGDYIKNSDFMYGDFNNNGSKEIYVFTQKGDSVFINGNEVLNHNSGSVIFYNKFIDTVKKSGGGFYDYYTMPGKLMDINSDNRKEIIFVIEAGFSLVPRRIYAYDIANDTVYKSPSYGNMFSELIFYDINNDGKEEIMGGCGSSGNFKSSEFYEACKKSHDKDTLKLYKKFKPYENVQYWDGSAWLMCFNSQLKLLFDPVEFKEFTSGISVHPYKNNKANYFAVLYHYWGNLKVQTFIALYDINGRQVKKKNIEYKTGMNIFNADTKNRNNLYLLNEKGFIYKLDNDLDTTETYNYSDLLGNYSYFLGSFDIDNDGKEELLFYHINKNKLVIFRDDFSDPVTFEVKLDDCPTNFSIKYNGKTNPQFSFKSKDKQYLIEYKRNEKYYLNYIYYLGIFIGLLIFIYIVQLISSYKLKKDKQRLEKTVMERTQEIREKNTILEQQREEITVQRDLILENNEELQQQKEEIMTQRDLIEEKNREVIDSINYAKRIQEAVLPVSDAARAVLGEHFILFKPKDIVSGDFYWTTQVNNWLIVTVADCTGHGVPGAFMSMLGISFLNEIVRKQEINKANQVLNELRKEIINALQQKGMQGEQKDGMDMALVIINTETLELQYAGANNPLYIISYINKELIEIKPDKMPIAIHEHMEQFTNHEYQLQKGDAIYLLSDGYEDQFGGIKYKKFMSKQLKVLLLANCEKPMPEQREILETTLIEWIGSSEQVDDITVMGIKI